MVYRLAVFIANTISCISRRAPLELRRHYRVDGLREARLFRILDAMTRYGCRYDPVVRVRGEELFDAALAQQRGVLIVGPHTMLTSLLVRHLYDRGYPPYLLAADTTRCFAGTNVVIEAGRPSPGALLRLARVLRRHGVVCALVDRRPQTPGAAYDVAEGLFHFAERLGTNMMFVATLFADDGVEAILEWPTREARTARELIADFIEFTNRQIATTQPQFRD